MTISPPLTTADKKQLVIELLKLKMSKKEIARQLGVSISTINRWLKT